MSAGRQDFLDEVRVLTGAGLLDRPPHPSSGERAEYLPTARSRSLWPVLLCIWEWERRWVAEVIVDI